MVLMRKRHYSRCTLLHPLIQNLTKFYSNIRDPCQSDCFRNFQNRLLQFCYRKNIIYLQFILRKPMKTTNFQEERELSDMEVSLHRTRSLLGEKVIHLRHLEQSLERVASAKRNENELASNQAAATTIAATNKSDEVTLSDMSSASSGFSSTDLGTDTFIGIFSKLFLRF